MKAILPNLELIVYKAGQVLAHDKTFVEAMKAKKDECKYAGVDFDVTVFSQVWGSTCTGFDILPDGSPTIGGCAMTTEYTTIVHERTTDCYCVFFGDSPCYKVDNANEDFFEDMKNHNMASLSKARARY